nr:RNA-directed DNA polymerase, eukaryota [Tanacetum cinerariifolium]
MVMSGSQRSKEDDVHKISTSVFVTNFPDGYGAKDLWNTCKLYGYVVDVFIPDRRTKAGKVKEFASLTNLKVVLEVPGWVPDFEEDGEEGYDMNDGSHEDDMHGDVLENLKDVEEGDVPVKKVDNWSDENRVNDGQEDGVCVRQHVHERVEVLNDTHKSTCSGHFKKSKVPRKEVCGFLWEEITYYIGICSSRFKRKKMLWDYLSFVIRNWDGEVVIMGDFNEVCDISERFGSIFNKHDAEAFNFFIVKACLVEVPLGGCSFTWCHKSAKKMSKLDRFLIFDNLMCSCPSISSTSLDRFLLDHRPIIMREAW